MIREALFVAGLIASSLSAQVGYTPPRSPYRDLEATQELTFFSGYYRARLDPAQVAPRSGPMIGAHYQWRIAGPANLTADLSRVASERRVLDPDKPIGCAPDLSKACNLIGIYRWPVYFTDIGVSMDLTGARSFYNLVPDVRAGVGLATDFHTKPDVGDFAFGTRFALTWGGGIRWVKDDRYQLRADLINHLYTVKYPESYYLAPPEHGPILNARQPSSSWLNNSAFTIGVSYLFSR